jgi:hypothetical protein
LPDLNKDGKADKIITLIEGLQNPHRLEVKCNKDGCKLFVAETERLMQYDFIFDEKNI